MWRVLRKDDSFSWASFWEDLRRRGTVTAQLDQDGPDAEQIPFEVKSSRVTFSGKEYAIAAGRDLRERRQAEAALRMASVGTLTAGIAHEINNPLTSVLGNLEFVAEELARARGSPGVAEHTLTSAVVEAEESARRIRDIVRDLQVFSRADDHEDANGADVGRAIKAALTLSRHEVRHRAQVAVELGTVPLVRGNERRLGQVFVNLLVNAAHAMPEGEAAAYVIRVSAYTEGEFVVADVEDTGCGMTPEVLTRVFEPFFTTKMPGSGTGLGLSICHGIVAASGGRIEASSRPGKGGRFRLWLPAAAPENGMTGQSKAEPEPPRSTSPARGRVLVVDDDPLVGHAVRRMLGEHEVVACTDLEVALALAREEPFGLVLCDLMMPEMSGIEFQARLAKNNKRLAEELIFVTGGAFTPAATTFLAQSPNTHLEKPFDTLRLRNEVSARIKRAASA